MLSEDELSTITDELALRWDVESVKAKEITVQADFTGDTKGTRARPFKFLERPWIEYSSKVVELK